MKDREDASAHTAPFPIPDDPRDRWPAMKKAQLIEELDRYQLKLDQTVAEKVLLRDEMSGLMRTCESLERELLGEQETFRFQKLEMNFIEKGMHEWQKESATWKSAFDKLCTAIGERT